jgi:hydroxymethylbilane synthase
LRLGTRGSALALAQAETVSAALGGLEIVVIETSGDRGRGGDKARFVKEIEEALLDEEVDLAVHSAKDLPTEIPGGLALVGVTEREDPSDAYCGGAGSLEGIPAGAAIGTSSLRRKAQLLASRDDIEVLELHGNVDTRLAKLEQTSLHGIVLASAGLRRLGREDAIAFRFDEDEMTPAAGQGVLALEAREGDSEAAAAAATVTDEAALVELTAERATIGALGASCNTPVGIRARLDGTQLTVDGFVGMPDGSRWVRDSIWGDPGQPGSLGLQLAEDLLNTGAATILRQAENYSAGSSASRPGPAGI